MRFDVLSRDLDVFAPHFLEASAGTGKTFAIEHLVTRLLIEGESPLSIEQILVVTFTRAATRELKLRIRRNLSRTKDELSAANPSADYLKAVCEKGEAAIKSAIERIEAALICYDSAQIYTLHGFCHRVLNEFAFESRVGMEVSDPDEKKHISLLEQMVKDHLKEEMASPDYSPVQIKKLLSKFRGEPRRMVSALVDLVSSGREISSHPSHAELLETFLKSVRSLPNIDAALLKADIELMIPHYKKLTGLEVSSQIDLLCGIIETKNCSPEQFDRLLKEEFFLEKLGADNIKVRAKLPDASAFHYPGLVEKLRGSLLAPVEMAKDSSRIFLRLAGDIQKKSHHLLEKKEKFSPDALLLKVEQALQMPHFVERVRQKYRAAIIDEFQDTDPVQWNIFQQLFLSHIDAICLVGDPKQSIYAFRNADVYTYLDAAKAMGESAKKHLDTNYRSTAMLVDALNLLFSKAQEGWMDLPGRKEPLEVIPVKAGAQIDADSNEEPVKFFVCIGKKGKSKKFPTTEMFETQAFPYIASELFVLHTEKKVEYHDIAILVKDRFQAQGVIDYLKKHGIPASFKRGVPLTDSPAYFALKEILFAVCSPYDLSKVKAALGGPLIDWNDEQLCKGLEDLALLEAKAQMQLLNHLLFHKGFGPFFQALLGTSFAAPHSLLQNLLLRGDLSLYLDLRKLAELLIEEETIRGLKGDAFLAYLEEIAIESYRDESRLRVPPQEEKGSVTVMTMHMSKGLEFDTVFVLGLASRHKLSDEMAIKQDGRSVLTMFDPANPDCQRTVVELDAEKMRQLYVALTRAKKRLYVPLMLDEEQKTIEYGEASPIELFFARIVERPCSHQELYATAQNLNIGCVRELLDTFKPLIGYCILEEKPELVLAHANLATCDLFPPPPLHLPAYNEQLLSFTALAKKDHHMETVKPAIDAPLSMHTLPLGSETGHLLHLLFEKIFKRGLHSCLDKEALSALIDEEIAFSSLAEWRSILLLWIVEILKKKLTTFALCDVPHTQLQQEMEFLFPVSQGLMKGFADLFFLFDGKYYLLDWKSNYLGPSDADYTSEKIAQVMQQNQYYLQASIYAEALERFVKLFDIRPFSECFGGAIYYFVRGKSAYHFIPESYKEQHGQPV